MRRLVVSLGVGLGGMALLLAGLSWDALVENPDGPFAEEMSPAALVAVAEG
jgi:hypothetical protein